MRRLALLALLLCACAEPSADGAGGVVAQESRYRVVAQSRAAGPGQGVLEVRVEASGGWHIAPEAPVRLDLKAADLSFSPAALRAAHARRLDAEAIEWSCALRAASAEPQIASGQLKFGICEGDAEQCVIIRRELEIPIDLAAAAATGS